MSRYNGQLHGGKGPTNSGKASPPPFRAMLERKHFFSGGVPLLGTVKARGASATKDFGSEMPKTNLPTTGSYCLVVNTRTGAKLSKSLKSH